MSQEKGCLFIAVQNPARAGGDPVLLPPLSLVWAVCFLSFFRAVLLPPLASLFSFWLVRTGTNKRKRRARLLKEKKSSQHPASTHQASERSACMQRERERERERFVVCMHEHGSNVRMAASSCSEKLARDGPVLLKISLDPRERC